MGAKPRSIHPKATLGIGRPDLAALASAAHEYADAESALANLQNDDQVESKTKTEARGDRDVAKSDLLEAALDFALRNPPIRTFGLESDE